MVEGLTRAEVVEACIVAARAATGADPRDTAQTHPVTFSRGLVMLALYDEAGFSQAEAAEVFGMAQSQFVYLRKRLLARCADSLRCVAQEREFQRLLAQRIG